MLRLELLLQAVDRLSAPIRAIQARMAGLRAVAERLGTASGANRLAGSLVRVGGAAAGAAQQVAGLAARMTALGAALGIGAGFAFNRQFIRPAAEMERFALTLETVLGSAEAGERALAWVSDFATRTPYELAEVTRAFVQLQTTGINPMDGAIRAAGDAAAIMGTRLDESVTAVAAAMRGEMEPLRRFGVQARQEGDRIFLSWRAQGREFASVVQRNNPGQMSAAIVRAFNDQFDGGMERLSQGWDGMLSNLADAWSRFSLMVMNAGVFDFLKQQLRDVLARVEELAADGTLQRWANETAEAILRVFRAVRAFFVAGEGQEQSPFEQLLTRLRTLLQPIADVASYFGGMETALAGIGLVLAGPFLASLAALTTSLAALSVVLLATPAGWFALAAGGLTALALAIRNNWGGLGDFVTRQIESIIGGLRALDEATGGTMRRLGVLPDGMVPFAGPSGPRVGPAPLPGLLNNLIPPSGGFFPQSAPGAPLGAPPPAANSAPMRVDTGGELRVILQDNRRPQVQGRMNDPNTRLSPDQGLMLGVP